MPGGSDLRAIEVGDELWAIVERVPEVEYGEAALARGLQNLDWVGPRALAHETIIESFLAAPALLPMQLFTLFTSDERVIEHVKKDRVRIARILKRVEKKVEWGLRLTFEEKAVRRSTDKRPVTGREFLARKRDVLDLSRQGLSAARAAATRVYKAMTRHAAASHRRAQLERATPGSRLLLDAAFLVPAARSAQFKSAVRRQTKELAPLGVTASLTGPWPAYNFIQ